MPAASRMSDSKKARIRKILPLIARNNQIIGLAFAKLFASDSTSKALKITKAASFNFFCSKVDYLLRHDEIKYLVGVETDVFSKLLELCQHSPRSKFSSSVRLAIFLKFVKEGITQNGLSREIGLSQSSISRIVKGIVDDLVAAATQFIKFPKTRSEIHEMQKGFFEKMDKHGNMMRMPCFAVLDGKHWECEHPPHSGCLNYNYKTFYSFNSLFLSDSKYRILYIQISELGVNCDAQLFSEGPLPSLLKAAAVTGGTRILPNSNTAMSPFVLADNGFGLSKTVMQPYRRMHLTSENVRFNEKISASRVKIENLFGILSSKFQIFQRALKLDPATSRGIIVACSVVHNITIGPLHVHDVDDGTTTVADPYKTPEEQRSALKHFLLH